MRNAFWEKETQWEGGNKAEKDRRGGITLRVGAGKPNRLTVTLNLSFRKKYGEFLECAHLNTYIYHGRHKTGFRGIFKRQIGGQHRLRKKVNRE